MAIRRDGKSDKRVGYVVPVGAGLDTFVYREIDALVAKGFEVHIFATKYKHGDVFEPKKEWGLYTLTPRQMLVRAPRILMRLMLHPLLALEAIKDKGLVDLVFALDFAPEMKRRGLRQIHCHFGDHKLFIGYYCKRLSGLPLSVTIHAHEFYTNPNPGLFRKSVLKCDMVFPIAEKWRRRLIEEFGVDPEKVQLNRLFVDAAVYKPVDEIRVIAVGRYTERKGFRYLIEALRYLQDLPVRAIFVGFGGNLDLKKIARDYSVADRVTVFGKLDQEQLRLLYQTVDIMCLPSITTKEEGAEGIPVVLMEALACGLPVVATRCGATDEIVEEILVDERSPEQLADGIRRLACDPELRKRQGARNRAIVLEKFSERNVDRFGNSLDGMVVGGPPKGSAFES